MTSDPRTNLFCKTSPRCQRAWDGTSLDNLVCKRKYQYSILDGWRKAKHLFEFGGAYHDAHEWFAKHVEELGFETCLRETVRFALNRSAHWETEEYLESDPKGSSDKARSRFGLIRAIVWYYTHYGEEYIPPPLTLPNGEPAVEVSFRIPLADCINPDGEPYLLVGHLDKLCEFMGQNMVQEYKHTVSTITSEYYWKRYSPNTQVSTYILGTVISLPDIPARSVLLDATQVAVGFARFDRQFVSRTKAQTDEHLVNLQAHIKEAEKCAEENYWPMNEAACGLYGGCDYQGVCKRDPAMREQILEANFTRQLWNPLDIRTGGTENEETTG